jgi:cell division septum initiation protein DivIVA
MTNDKLKILVSEAVRLDRQIAQLQEQLDAKKSALATEAETRADEASPTEGGGLSITFEGADGCVARVTTAGPTLKSAVKPTDKKLDKIKTAAKGLFARLFETEVVYKPVQNFREQAKELLGASDARALVKLIESKGKTTVSFETKEGGA